MKKSLFVMLIALISIFSYNEVCADACQACLAPKSCFVANFEVPGFPGCKVEATLCYYCGAAVPTSSIEVLEIKAPLCNGVNITDLAWDYIDSWILNNLDILCGVNDCYANGFKTTAITKYLCERVEWDTYHITRTANLDDCGTARCTRYYKSCYCNCTDWCYKPGCTPHWISEELPDSPIQTGTPTCFDIPYGVNTNHPFSSNLIWIIPCDLNVGCE